MKRKKGKCMKCGHDDVAPRYEVMLDQLKYRCNCGHVWFDSTYEADFIRTENNDKVASP